MMFVLNLDLITIYALIVIICYFPAHLVIYSIYSIGNFHSTCTGRLHHTIPPDKSATIPEDFWSLNPHGIDAWNQDMNQLKSLYVMKKFPSKSQCDNHPMMLTSVSSYETPERIVKGFNIGPKKSDVFVLSMQDRLYEPHAFINYENSHLIMSDSFHIQQVRKEYVHSYVIKNLSV